MGGPEANHVQAKCSDRAEKLASLSSPAIVATERVKKGLPEMLKGGVIMDVTNVEEAKIAQEAGACAVMALEKIPSDIRKEGGVCRMSDPEMILKIQAAVSIPVMAKCRIGHFVEAQILQEVGVDCIDESEVLTTADEEFHIDKKSGAGLGGALIGGERPEGDGFGVCGFSVPFVCGCRNLGEALRRINEGACMIRTKGEAGTGNIVEAVRHIRAVKREIERLRQVSEKDKSVLSEFANRERVPVELLVKTVQMGRLPVTTFAAGGVATPADAALCMQLGMDGVFVGSGIFRSEDPAKRARSIVQAVTFYQKPSVLAKVSRELGEAMTGYSISQLKEKWSGKESLLDAHVNGVDAEAK